MLQYMYNYMQKPYLQRQDTKYNSPLALYVRTCCIDQQVTHPCSV